MAARAREEAFPLFPAKTGLPPVCTPEAFLDYMRRSGKRTAEPLPASAVMCYKSVLVSWVEKNQETGRVGGLPGGRIVGGDVVVCGGFGMGAPAAVVLMEELIARGVRRIISVGEAGSLDQSAAPGDIVLCTKALRDEGTSHHYLPSERFAHPSGELTAELCRVLDERQTPYIRGPSWTTDAPYRETREEVAAYGARGILTVEMEAAALFAVGRYRGVQVAALFSVSDSLAGGTWRPHFSDRRSREGLLEALQAALQTALQTAKGQISVKQAPEAD